MVKALGICASPRKGGNSEIIIDSFLDGVKTCGNSSVNKIFLSDLVIKFCREDECCRESGECDMDDDMRAIYKDFDDADIVAISAPVYFGSIPAKLKLMVDRFQPHWIKKEVFKKPPLTQKKRKGVFLCVSASNREDFFKNARQVIRNLYSMLGIEYSGEIYCGDVDNRGDIKDKADIISRACRMGEDLVKNF
ncbi:MAG: flavodoxin family protein [Candidatus Omnitrophota bacterium]|jgi:multimeric flavodoxin WrbA